MTDREKLQSLAERLCLKQLERTANRMIKNEVPEVADWVGYECTLLENLCRPFWGIAPLLKFNRYIITVNGQSTDLCHWLRETLIKGTDPNSPTRFDRYSQTTGINLYANQSITELAGLLIGIYFAKDAVWEPLSQKEKDQIAAFMLHWAEIALENSWPNNHYWFPMFCLLVLKRLGYPHKRYREMIDKGFEVLDKLYLDRGWYADGAFGRFDYYLAWSHNAYPLIWCLIESEDEPDHFERFETYKRRAEAFLSDFIYWFDSNGSHVPFGRSLTYRFAASCLFPIAALAGCNINLGLARNIAMKNVEYFIQNSLPLKESILLPGFLYSSPALVENYTSDGGAYWCCKSFMALLMDQNHPYWTAEPYPFPAQQGDYLHKAGPKDVHMLFEHSIGSGTTLYNNTASYCQGSLAHPFNDMGGYYSKFAYNSRSGFGVSSRDNVSLDNMIGLTTPDCTMTSHRLGFTDLGYRDGVLYSRHIPFSNDPNTIISTALLPLGGYHVRVHKINLANSYIISEGGFSLGHRNDYCVFTAKSDSCCIKTDTMLSEMGSTADFNIYFTKGIIQPGMHILHPLASYPCLKTKPLEKGCYRIASWFYVGDLEKEKPAPPVIKINDNAVEIYFLNKTYKIDLDF